MRRALSFAAVAVFTLVASSSAFALPNDKFQGKPKFTAGGSLGAYVWHDGDGHHVRFTTVANKVVRRFHGKVCGKDVTAVKAVRTEVGDGVKVGPKGHCVMFDFKTNAGARGYQTRLRLPYHTDSSDVVGLLCLNPAKSGGLSSVASTTSAYNEVVKRRPDLAHLWFEQWHFDRRNEQQPGQDPFYLTRLATWDGSNLSIRYVRSFLESAQRHDAVPAHTADQTAFLELVDEISNEEGFALKMDFRPGDMQFVCNYTTFHSRTAYEDHEDPAKKRHLLRLWLTLHEGRPIPDDFGRGAQAGKAGRGGIEPVPGVAEEMAGTYA